MKNSRAYRNADRFSASSQIRLCYIFIERNPLLFLNLINTDVESNGIVSRNLNTELVNYYLSNLLIICNMLEIVMCTHQIVLYIINILQSFYKTNVTLRKNCKISFTNHIKILTNKKL